MIGLFFIFTVITWLSVSVWLAHKLGNFVSSSEWRAKVKISIFLFLLSLPFVDELIGKLQYDALCKANGVESADVSRARGKKVKVKYGERTAVKGTIVPIKESDMFFRDADSGEILIKAKNYYAEGGWVMRYTWLSLGSSRPMLFGGSTCDVRKEQEIFKANSITFLYE